MISRLPFTLGGSRTYHFEETGSESGRCCQVEANSDNEEPEGDLVRVPELVPPTATSHPRSTEASVPQLSA